MLSGAVHIRENLEQVRERIRLAALRASRRPEDIQLVAVTKMVPVALIREAIAAGVEIFGENRVQEALPKIQEVGSDRCRWHLVGHLQTNKVRWVAGLFDLVHSVDSLKLARVLDAMVKSQSGGQSVRQKVLIQVNVSGESTKFGISPDRLVSQVKEMVQCQGLEIRGLMTIPPAYEDPERARPFYRTLRELAVLIHQEGIDGVSMQELSMGMSNDFEVGVEEGATLVRIGMAIFGPRR